MSDKEKLIARLKENDLLDEESVSLLRERLKNKLKSEANDQEKEMVILQKEIRNFKLRILR